MFLLITFSAMSAQAQTCSPLTAPLADRTLSAQGSAAVLAQGMRLLQDGDNRGALTHARLILDREQVASTQHKLLATGLTAAAQAAAGSLAAARPWVEQLEKSKASADAGIRPQLDLLHAWVELRAGNLDRAESLLRAALAATPAQATQQALRIQLTIARAPLNAAKRVTASWEVLNIADHAGLNAPAERAAALEILAELAPAADRVKLQALARDALRKDARDAQAASLHYSLAAVSLANRDLASAATHSRQLERAWLAAGRQPDPRWMWLRAQVLEAQGEYSQAGVAYDLAVAEASRQRQPLDAALLASGLSFQQRFATLFDAYLAYLLGPHSTLTAEASLRKAVEVAELSRLADITGLVRDPCLVADAQKKSELADAHTAVLYPVLLEDRVELLLVTRDGIRRATSRLSRGDMQARANRFLTLLQQYATRLYLPTARSLHEVLIAPMVPQLRSAGIKHLVVAPDGVLRTIPFAALHDGQRFLIEDFSLSVVPGLNLTQAQPMNRDSIKTLAVGLSEARQGFEALPAVEQELSFVARALQCTPVLNRSFTTQRLRQDLSGSRASVVHVASHAEFSPDPRDTFLLTYDGKLGLEDIRDALLTSARQRAPLDLLVLSACQTAVGDERAALGLAGMALRTGARSAVASLWQVSDDSTNQLVQRFYAALIAEGKSRGEALRLAQLDVLASKDFSHPAFWAPFILVGNWM